MFRFAKIMRWGIVTLVTVMAGCTVHPPGEADERATVAAIPRDASFFLTNNRRDVVSLKLTCLRKKN